MNATCGFKHGCDERYVFQATPAASKCFSLLSPPNFRVSLVCCFNNIMPGLLLRPLSAPQATWTSYSAASGPPGRAADLAFALHGGPRTRPLHWASRLGSRFSAQSFILHSRRDGYSALLGPVGFWITPGRGAAASTPTGWSWSILLPH
jgi:hypothetical protein